ncbi:unnamed protein product [Schistosoma margrebowiei]|uniref:Uncharacterized protein n=1 Tax=Schistosoma margrebowiei TaxID=48269 RepID=A0A183N772_9TREM|nr:unnamed protein product [Schistosoma margrebowiei]
MVYRNKVSDDEARRRAKRRERNRVAAAKCRQRRQDQIEELQHRVDALTRTGQELRSSLHSLDLERARLESLVEEHKFSQLVSYLSNKVEILQNLIMSTEQLGQYNKDEK